MGGPGAAAGIFDGIDLDWEWPGSEGNAGNIIRPQDKQNFTLLVQEFREQLDAYGETTGKDYLLTAFLPAARAKIDAGFEVADVFESLDFATVQGYDLHGTWESTTNHQSNLHTSKHDPSSPRFSVDGHGQRVPRTRRAGGQDRDRRPVLLTGLDGCRLGEQRALPAGRGARRRDVFANGVEDYKALKGLVGDGFDRYWDGNARAGWIFDGTTFWTFDDPKAMKQKALYVRQQNLGGIMFWELSGDTPDGELIDAIADGLKD